MKTLLVIFLLFGSITINAQTYVIVEPQNQRFGIMQAFMSENMESYVSSVRISPYIKAWTGTINGHGFHSWTAKESIGMRITGRHDKTGYFLAGIAYSQFFAHHVDEDNLLGKLKPLTFEFGFSTRLDNGIWILMITDPLNWESCIGIGWDFTRRQQIYNSKMHIK